MVQNSRVYKKRRHSRRHTVGFDGFPRGEYAVIVILNFLQVSITSLFVK